MHHQVQGAGLVLFQQLWWDQNGKRFKPRNVPVVVLPLFWNQHHLSCLWQWINEVMQQYRLRRVEAQQHDMDVILEAAGPIHPSKLYTRVFLLLNLSTKSPEGPILSHPSLFWHNFLSGENTVLQIPPAANTKEGFWRTIFKCTSLQLNNTPGLLGISLILWSASAIKVRQRHGHFSDKCFISLRKKCLQKLWNQAGVPKVKKKKKKWPGLAPNIKLLWKSWLETRTCNPKVQAGVCRPI